VPTQTSNNKLNIIRASHLNKFPWLIHGFSTRQGGYSQAYGKSALNLGFTKEDSKSAVERNRAAFLGALGVAGTPLVTLRQIHSDMIRYVDATVESPIPADGLITATPGLLLGIQTADCLPIILVDPKHRAVGVFHAGWRGTVKRIGEKGVGEMRRCFGSRPRDLAAVIGPGIRGCCYEVGEEVRHQFESQFAYAAKLFREVKDSDPVREKYPLLFLSARPPGHSELPKRIFLDLAEANRQQLLAVGVSPKHIEVSTLCTNCRTDLLFSYRAEKGKTGRMMTVVGMFTE
jgi:polyphenol oxidase